MSDIIKKNTDVSPELVSINFAITNNSICKGTIGLRNEELSLEDIQRISHFLIAIEKSSIKDLLNECIYNKYLEFEKQKNEIGIRNIESILKTINDASEVLKLKESCPVISPLEVFHGNNMNFEKGGIDYNINKKLSDFEIKWTPYFIFEDQTDEDDEDEDKDFEEELGNHSNIITDEEDIQQIPIPAFLLNAGNIIPQEDVKIYTIDTNFNITKPIVEILNTKIDGIEGIKVISRYKVRVMVGKLFDVDDIQVEVRRHVAEYLKSICKI